MFIVSSTAFSFAANPSAPFSPSDNILNPDCLPTDSNCYVNISTLNLTAATSTNFFSSILNAVSAIFTNLTATNATTTNMAVSGGTLSVESPANISVVGSLNVPVSAVVVSGNYAYLSAGTNFVVLDVTDPINPRLVSSSTIPHGQYSVGLRVAGNYAYLTFGGENLQVVDISNPAAPVFLGSTPYNFGWAENVFVSGKYAYTAKANGGFFVIDISNPNAPLEINAVSHGAGIGPGNIFVSGKYAYVSFNSTVKGLRIYDISVPTNITLIGTYTNTTGIAYTQVSGKYAYAATYTGGLEIINISNPSSPTLVSTYSPGGAASINSDIVIAGKYLYTGDSVNGKFYVINISDPTLPQLSTTLSGVYPSNSALGNGIAVSGKYAYVADMSSSTLKIIDLKGADISTANIGNIKSSDIWVNNNLDVGNNINAKHSVTVGLGGIFSNGPLSVARASSTSLSEVSAYFAGRVGIGTTSSLYSLTVGNAAISGVVARFQNSTGYCDINPTTTSLTCTSDRRLKKNITSLNSETVVNNIFNLNPVTYNWLNENDASSTHAGFIAQEVQPLFPDLVSADQDGTLSVSYGGFIPYIIQSIKSFRSDITTEMICVGTNENKTCINKSQLDQLLQNNQIAPSQPEQVEILSADDIVTATTTQEVDTGTSTATTTEAEPAL